MNYIKPHIVAQNMSLLYLKVTQLIMLFPITIHVTKTLFVFLHVKDNINARKMTLSLAPTFAANGVWKQVLEHCNTLADKS